MSRAPDVVVVGAGVVGSAAAYFLAGDGARVTLIERDAVGSHASGFAFGGIIPVESAPHGHVGPPGLGELAVRLHRELASVLPRKAAWTPSTASSRASRWPCGPPRSQTCAGPSRR